MRKLQQRMAQLEKRNRQLKERVRKVKRSLRQARKSGQRAERDNKELREKMAAALRQAGHHLNTVEQEDSAHRYTKGK